jgi:hypothetical protein
MAKLRKTWREKLHDSKHSPQVIEVTPEMNQKWGTGTCVIPAPIEVDGIMRTVPKGKVITVNHIRKVLAERHNASFG